MADMEEFNEITQRAKVGAGFKGGPFFQSPILHPAMTISDGVPAEVKEKLQTTQGISQGTPEDPWYGRHTTKK